MEAKDLMIGDLLWLTNRVGSFISKVNLEGLKAIQDCKIGAKPIPITEEILKLNGLWCHDDIEWWYDLINQIFMFKIHGSIKSFEGPLVYVHELSLIHTEKDTIITELNFLIMKLYQKKKQ